MLLALAGFAFLRLAQAPFRWSKVEVALSPSIQVYCAATTIPSTAPRVWYVDIDTTDKNLGLAPYFSRGLNSPEQGSSMSTGQNALVVINGGYFVMQGVPARTYSLVLCDGKVFSPNLVVVHRSFVATAWAQTRWASSGLVIWRRVIFEMFLFEL